MHFKPTNSTNPQNLVLVRNTRLRNPYESWIKSIAFFHHIILAYQHVYIIALAYLIHVVHPKSNLRKDLLTFRDICEHFYVRNCGWYLLITHNHD
jgi:hypothetical protein